MLKTVVIVLWGLVILFSTSFLAYGRIAGSKHDLSTSITPEPCVFCHTPHHSSTTVPAPLWNRGVGTLTYTMYTSPTMNTQPATTPNVLSLVCLGCHNGVAAPINAYNDDKHGLLNAPGPGGIPDLTSYPNCERCHPDFYGGQYNPWTWLGTDLSNDHPISMPYPTPQEDPEFHTPPDSQHGWGDSEITLYNGRVECPSCHTVHDPTNPPFLRKANAGSAMCLTCHIK